ncbi:hypothetical protein LCGC14_2460180 [marine sediment metagenome]|uniref:Uncharacterized protein n=1 Tax=marine sediment metagenome TaxID=412755 RepID=A0A0F9C163_9ZZZZ
MLDSIWPISAVTSHGGKLQERVPKPSEAKCDNWAFIQNLRTFSMTFLPALKSLNSVSTIYEIPLERFDKFPAASSTSFTL